MSDIQYGAVSFTQNITEPKMFPYANDTTSGGNINKERNLVRLIRSITNKSFAVKEGSYDIHFESALDGNGRALGYENIVVSPGVAVVGGYYVESQRTITISGNDGQGGDKFENINYETTDVHIYLWLEMDGNGNNVIGANIQIGELPTDEDIPVLNLGTLSRNVDNNKLSFTQDPDKYAMINISNLFNDKELADLKDSSLVQVINEVTNNLISTGVTGGILTLNHPDQPTDNLALKYYTSGNGSTDTWGVVELLQVDAEPGQTPKTTTILQWTFGKGIADNKEGTSQDDVGMYVGTDGDTWTNSTPWVQEQPQFIQKLWVNKLKCHGTLEAPGIVSNSLGITISKDMLFAGPSVTVNSPMTFNPGSITTMDRPLDLANAGKLTRGDSTIIDENNKVYGAVWN